MCVHYTLLARFYSKTNFGGCGRLRILNLNLIILEILWENFACVAALFEILKLFSKEDPSKLWSESCKMVKSLMCGLISSKIIISL